MSEIDIERSPEILVSMNTVEPSALGDDELNARVHEEVFGRDVTRREAEGESADPQTLDDRETGQEVPDYVSDPFAVFQRFGEWGYSVFARGGETLEDGTEGFCVMAESPDHGTMTVRSQSRGRAYGQAAPCSSARASGRCS